MGEVSVAQGRNCAWGCQNRQERREIFFYFLLPYMEIRKGGRKTFFPSGIRIEKESKICFVIFHSMLPSFLVGFEVSFLFRITNNS